MPKPGPISPITLIDIATQDIAEDQNDGVRQNNF
jgi:hypothetical protein